MRAMTASFIHRFQHAAKWCAALDSYLGLSNRSIFELRPMEAAKMIPNLAIFSRPNQEGMLTVTCINRVILRKAT